MEVEGFKPPQEEVVPIRRSAMTHRAPDQLCLNIEVEEHSLEDLNEPNNYKATISDVRNKIHKAFPLPVIEFPLPEKVPTASEESCHYQKKRDAIAVKIALLLKSRRNCQSKSNDSYAIKYKTAQELWAAILKIFDGNEATKKMKKNLLKQQYGN
nr:zinc finger, CCHC-type [Tanacetum cinerariifolium]